MDYNFGVIYNTNPSSSSSGSSYIRFWFEYGLLAYLIILESTEDKTHMERDSKV